MILFIEGPRHVGKTHLLKSFFENNKNPEVVYYKFAFAKYIDELEMRDQESGPGVHYFSISNVLTLLELNQTILKDKIIVFDRSIFSAYVWSIYRNRMDRERLFNEFEKILKSDLYQNCVLFYLNRKEMPEPVKREKDYFSNFENYLEEKKVFDEIISRFEKHLFNSIKNTTCLKFTNYFNQYSIDQFCELLSDLSSVTLLLNK